MPDAASTLARLITAATKPKDPLYRVGTATELIEELNACLATARAVRGDALRAAHEEAGVTWEELGELLGVSGQRAHQLSKPSITEAIK